MRTTMHKGWLGAALALVIAGTAGAQVGSPVPSTPYTRQLLTNATAAGARATLGLASTNAGVVVDFDPTQFQTNDMVLRLTNGVALTNAQSFETFTHSGTSLAATGTTSMTLDTPALTVGDSTLGGGPVVEIGGSITLSGATGQINATNVYVDTSTAPDANQLVWRGYLDENYGAPGTTATGTNVVNFLATGWGDLSATNSFGVMVVTNASGVVTWQKMDGTVIQSFNPTNIVFGLPIVGDGAGVTNLNVTANLGYTPQPAAANLTNWATLATNVIVPAIAAGTNVVAITNAGVVTVNSVTRPWVTNVTQLELHDPRDNRVVAIRPPDEFTGDTIYIGDMDLWRGLSLQVANEYSLPPGATNVNPRISLVLGLDEYQDHEITWRFREFSIEDGRDNELFRHDENDNIWLGHTNDTATVTVRGDLIARGTLTGDGSGLTALPTETVIGANRNKLRRWDARTSQMQVGSEWPEASTNVVELVVIGDSWSAGRFIVEPLRRRLQTVYGNGGIGYWSPNAIAEKPGAATYSMTGFAHNSWTNGLGLTSLTATNAAALLSATSYASRVTVFYQTAPGGGTITAGVVGGTTNTWSTDAALGLASTNIWQGTAMYAPVHLTVSDVGVTFCGVEFAVEHVRGVRVHNLAASGNKGSYQTNQTAADWEAQLATLNPDAVMVMLGVNDRDSSVAQADFAAQLTEIADRVESATTNATLFFVAQSDTDEPGDGADYRDTIASVARTGGIGFVDAFGHMGTYEECVALVQMANERHVNVAGGLVIARLIGDYLMPGMDDTAVADITTAGGSSFIAADSTASRLPLYGAGNTVFGESSAQYARSFGTGNLLSGRLPAHLALAVGNNNTLLGERSGYNATALGSHNFIAGFWNASGATNIGLANFMQGWRNFYNATNIGDAQFAAGYANFYTVPSPSGYAVAHGYRNAYSATTVGVNAFLSGTDNAYLTSTLDANNILIGNQNAYGASTLGRETTLIGWRNFYGATTVGNYNFVWGRNNGLNLTNAGAANIMMGFALSTNVARIGSGNIFLGTQLQMPYGENASGVLNIGGVLFGTGLHSSLTAPTNSAVGGKIGINTTNMVSTLNVGGDVTASNFVATAGGRIQLATAGATINQSVTNGGYQTVTNWNYVGGQVQIGATTNTGSITITNAGTYFVTYQLSSYVDAAVIVEIALFQSDTEQSHLEAFRTFASGATPRGSTSFNGFLTTTTNNTPVEVRIKGDANATLSVVSQQLTIQRALD